MLSDEVIFQPSHSPQLIRFQTILVEVHEQLSDPINRLLKLYKLRAKVEIKPSQTHYQVPLFTHQSIIIILIILITIINIARSTSCFLRLEKTPKAYAGISPRGAVSSYPPTLAPPS